MQIRYNAIRNGLWSGFNMKIDPRLDKTNKIICAPSEDSDQPGHPPSLIRVSAVRLKQNWVLSYPLSAQRRLWSDWADAQADLSLRWAQKSFCWVCHEVAQNASSSSLCSTYTFHHIFYISHRGGARWLSGRVSDSGARGPGFETYRRRVVSLSKTLYSPKVLVNYPGSDGSVPTWLKNCWLGR